MEFGVCKKRVNRLRWRRTPSLHALYLAAAVSGATADVG